jgi:hypothetical protein
VARRQIGSINTDFVVKGGGSANKQTGGASAGDAPHYTDVDIHDIDAMRTALAAFNGTRYTSARLAAMTVNDMTFACRREGLLQAVVNAVK